MRRSGGGASISQPTPSSNACAGCVFGKSFLPSVVCRLVVLAGGVRRSLVMASADDVAQARGPRHRMGLRLARPCRAGLGVRIRLGSQRSRVTAIRWRASVDSSVAAVVEVVLDSVRRRLGDDVERGGAVDGVPIFTVNRTRDHAPSTSSRPPTPSGDFRNLERGSGSGAHESL